MFFSVLGKPRGVIKLAPLLEILCDAFFDY